MNPLIVLVIAAYMAWAFVKSAESAKSYLDMDLKDHLMGFAQSAAMLGGAYLLMKYG